MPTKTGYIDGWKIIEGELDDPEGNMVANCSKDGSGVRFYDDDDGNHRYVPVHVLVEYVKSLAASDEQGLNVKTSEEVVIGMHPELFRRLEEMACHGLWGIGVSGVAQRLVEDGVRNALERQEERELRME